ncbi:DUF2284 domain-containing protein [Chloroflexota bacterium]
MDKLGVKILERAGQMGFTESLAFDTRLLVPQKRIRGFCEENKCGDYNNNYMCPPYVGSLDEIKGQLEEFHWGILLRYSRSMEIKKGNREITESKVTFLNKILQLEEFVRGEGIEHMWGICGGSCGLCEPCHARLNVPCLYPDKARASLEALGIEVLDLLDELGLDNRFYPDKITWTGCILFDYKSQGTCTSEAYTIR